MFACCWATEQAVAADDDIRGEPATLIDSPIRAQRRASDAGCPTLLTRTASADQSTLKRKGSAESGLPLSGSSDATEGEEIETAQSVESTDTASLPDGCCTEVLKQLGHGDDADADALHQHNSLLSLLDYDELPQRRPPIGGCVGITESHSRFLLPLEAILFDPSQEEIFQDGKSSGGQRQIFLNTPLTEAEVAALQELHESLRGKTGGDGAFPAYMAPHALRILQQSKYDTARALRLMERHLTDRVMRLPISEADVLEDLRRGFMYWHGRDRKCRPCLVIRLERMGDLIKDSERAIRLVIFVLEYALKFAMVPGRVENWVVILDLKNVLKVVSLLHLPGIVSTASTIANALENIYCGRMAWMQIVNMPGKRGTLAKLVNGAIPAEKKHKVSIVEDAAQALAGRFEPHQVEAQYGGTAPDLAPEETYPFHFFPDATGSRASNGTRESTAQETSYHAFTNRPFQQGVLWDSSSSRAQEAWIHTPQNLTVTAAEALSSLTEGSLETQPCLDVERWIALARGIRKQETEESMGEDVTKVASWKTHAHND
jgi:hypothetical protein